MKNHQVTFNNFRQFSLHCKFITIFAKASNDVVNMIFWSIFLTAYCNFVIAAINPRTHKICHTAVKTNVFAVNVLFVNCCRNKPSVRASNWTSAFPVNCHWIKTCWNYNSIVFSTNEFCNIIIINSFITRLIRNTDSTA